MCVCVCVPCSSQCQSDYEEPSSHDTRSNKQDSQSNNHSTMILFSGLIKGVSRQCQKHPTCTQMHGQMWMLIHTCCVGLKTTREVSSGQHVFGGPLISAPQLHQYPLQSGDELLILASDGLWDKVDSKAAVREARRHLALEGTTPASCAQVLVRIHCLFFGVQHLSHLSIQNASSLPSDTLRSTDAF